MGENRQRNQHDVPANWHATPLLKSSLVRWFLDDVLLNDHNSMADGKCERPLVFQYCVEIDDPERPLAVMLPAPGCHTSPERAKPVWRPVSELPSWTLATLADLELKHCGPARNRGRCKRTQARTSAERLAECSCQECRRGAIVRYKKLAKDMPVRIPRDHSFRQVLAKPGRDQFFVTIPEYLEKVTRLPRAARSAFRARAYRWLKNVTKDAPAASKGAEWLETEGRRVWFEERGVRRRDECVWEIRCDLLEKLASDDHVTGD